MRAVIMLVLVVGCAAPAPTEWTKAEATPSDLERDRYTCTQEARAKDTVIVDESMMRNVQRTPLFRLCMQARGWRPSQ